MNNKLNLSSLTQAALEARGLAMDSVAQAHSGHLGLPLGCAEIGAVLFGHVLNMDPEEPEWINRDRFVLSAGHGSMFLYAWLHLSGFDLSLEDLKAFRQLYSKTPGHPEFRHTKGVECTTGPLGQGVGNAVGMALAAKMAAAHFNTSDFSIFNHSVIVLCGDGCMQEGIVSEASAFAGHNGLDNLIIIYDSNDVTLDALANKTQSEDTALRYKAYGFDVEMIDGHNMELIAETLLRAKSNLNGKPKLIIAKTKIGKGIAEVEGNQKAHGEAGIKFIPEARKQLGLPEARFYVSEQTRAYFKERTAQLAQKHQAWKKDYEAWKQVHPDASKLLESGLNYHLPENLFERIPAFKSDQSVATRSAGEVVLQHLAQAIPTLISGSADLHGSTKNLIQKAGDFSRTEPKGRNIYFGIREHGMGAIVNGIAYYGIFRASGATFLTFSDYMRPAVRLAALSEMPVFYIWTHDSVGVGEDGPTHQPVETISSLRLIPNLDVIRPGDAEETVGAYIAALERTEGPTALILSRQNLPLLNVIPLQKRRQDVLNGGYIAKEETAALKLIIIATGSELQHAIKAAETLGNNVRVVSMPCVERFERQPDVYKETVLPSACRARIAIEAGATALWHKYVGIDGKVIGIDRFGLSAPGDEAMQALGITAEALIQMGQSFLHI
jgi:transketolase